MANEEHHDSASELDPGQPLQSRIWNLEKELEEDRLRREGAYQDDGWWLERFLRAFGLGRKEEPGPDLAPMSEEERELKETLLKELRAQAKISGVTRGMTGSS